MALQPESGKLWDPELGFPLGEALHSAKKGALVSVKLLDSAMAKMLASVKPTVLQKELQSALESRPELVLALVLEVAALRWALA
jgi:hypothetical protein